jgi:hypothetical protein
MDKKDINKKEKRYSVSLVFFKNIPNGNEINLKVLITNASSKEEALGKTIIHYENITKSYNLSNQVIIELQ